MAMLSDLHFLDLNKSLRLRAGCTENGNAVHLLSFQIPRAPCWNIEHHGVPSISDPIDVRNSSSRIDGSSFRPSDAIVGALHDCSACSACDDEAVADSDRHHVG